MAGFIEGVDRGQSVLFPDRLDDWIGEDSLVRVVVKRTASFLPLGRGMYLTACFVHHLSPKMHHLQVLPGGFVQIQRLNCIRTLDDALCSCNVPLTACS